MSSCLYSKIIFCLKINKNVSWNITVIIKGSFEHRELSNVYAEKRDPLSEKACGDGLGTHRQSTICDAWQPAYWQEKYLLSRNKTIKKNAWWCIANNHFFISKMHSKMGMVWHYYCSTLFCTIKQSVKVFRNIWDIGRQYKLSIKNDRCLKNNNDFIIFFNKNNGTCDCRNAGQSFKIYGTWTITLEEFFKWNLFQLLVWYCPCYTIFNKVQSWPSG